MSEKSEKGHVMEKTKTVDFQAEIKQILDLVIHSLYSEKDIFLRELISNSYDATQKRRLAGLENSDLALDGKPEIWIKVDKDARTLTVSDNGIGMTPQEVETNIGTIAHSGTKEFTEKLGKLKENPDLIGQFGVGFYSSFMVADKVELVTQKAGTTEGTHWVSSGDGTYTLSAIAKEDGPGTAITVHLKVLPDEATGEDFTDSWVIQNTVKKYSDFLDVPIKTMTEKTEPVLDGEGKPIEGKSETKMVEETLNSMKAIWLKPASSLKPEDYSAFYKQTCRDWTDPLEVIHYKAEGAQEFAALLFVPASLPFDFHNSDRKSWGPSLYIKKVFISEHVRDLLPQHLRFLGGVVDSNDIPLNVSREILQKGHHLKALSKALVHKVFRHFEDLMKKNRPQYEKLWKVWGPTIKEGIPGDPLNKERIEKICLFRSTHGDGWTSLSEYVGRMKPDQKAIYFMTGHAVEQLAQSPHMEKMKEKDYEVLLLVDHVDEWLAQSFREFDGKDMINLIQDDLKLGEGENKESDSKLQESLDKEYAPLKEMVLKTLPDDIKEVRVSTRLVDSPVCIVSGQHDPSTRMEKLMANFGNSMPKTKRIFEINPNHVAIKNLLTLSEDRQKDWIEILFHQCLINEGLTIDNPHAFTKKVTGLMTELSQQKEASTVSS